MFDHFKYRYFHPVSSSPSGSELIAEVEIPLQNHRLLPDLSNSKLFIVRKTASVFVLSIYNSYSQKHLPQPVKCKE